MQMIWIDKHPNVAEQDYLTAELRVVPMLMKRIFGV